MFLGLYEGHRSLVRTTSPFQLEVNDDPPFFIDGTNGFRHLNSVGPSYCWGPHAELVQNDQTIEVYTLRGVAQGLELLIDYGFCEKQWHSSIQCSFPTHAHTRPNSHIHQVRAIAGQIVPRSRRKGKVLCECSGEGTYMHAQVTQRSERNNRSK